MNVIVLEFPFIVSSISEGQNSLAVFKTLYILSFKSSSIRPDLFPLSVLSVILPKAFIPKSYSNFYFALLEWI